MNYYKKNNFVLVGKHGREFLVDIVVPETLVSSPVIVFAHGFKGFKDWGPFNIIADFFASKGFIFLKFNFAFNGTTLESPYDFDDLEAFGNNNFTKELDDLDVVIDWVTSNAARLNADISKLSLIGHSRGGGISILKGFEDNRINKVVTWASVAEFARHVSKKEIVSWKNSGVLLIENARTKQMMPLYIQLYNDYVKHHRRFNIRNAVRNFSKPLLIAHGTNDDTVPFSHAVELSELNKMRSKLFAINGGGHTFGAAHPLESDVLTAHFMEVVIQTEIFLKTV
ncbi:MAG: prolyl oligopeptidase family serine peptidase [Bacteroidetes bacterium]|nr:prolyl oligopeptidase family serine peptidase [Bacteroidota bacterium]